MYLCCPFLFRRNTGGVLHVFWRQRTACDSFLLQVTTESKLANIQELETRVRAEEAKVAKLTKELETWKVRCSFLTSFVIFTRVQVFILESNLLVP